MKNAKFRSPHEPAADQSGLVRTSAKGKARQRKIPAARRCSSKGMDAVHTGPAQLAEARHHIRSAACRPVVPISFRRHLCSGSFDWILSSPPQCHSSRSQVRSQFRDGIWGVVSKPRKVPCSLCQRHCTRQSNTASRKRGPVLRPDDCWKLNQMLASMQARRSRQPVSLPALTSA